MTRAGADPQPQADCTGSDAGAFGVFFRPDPAAWRLAQGSSTRDENIARFRSELGLPIDRPIVMSGHQAQVWHPGILAKLLALRAFAQRSGACGVWLVVDHDDHDPFTVRAPIIGADGRLAVVTFGPPPGAEGVPVCRRGAWNPDEAWRLPAGARAAAPGVEAGTQRIYAALARHAAAENAGEQTVRAAWDLLPDGAGEGIVVIHATALARTTLFGELVERMQRDPAACIAAHNAAVREFPNERIAPLGDGELPLWSIGAAMGSVRKRVFAGERASRPGTSAEGEVLAPRALLLTGLMRLAGCDLFVHGLGGERYDRITERWLGAWLSRTLAPTVMATATVRLRVPGCWPSPEEIARAAWTAHRARHDPGAIGDEARAARKRELLESIGAAPPRSPERATLFDQLHDLLRESERANAAALAEMDARAAAKRARAGEAAIAADRTWAFPLYEPDQLAALQREIESRFA
ncbi:MAG: hypothetical protein KF699_03320 [Phycisphaeraceae bacterium]|nr:hypothetical protein [Phycisphaeraceae bacterium]